MDLSREAELAPLLRAQGGHVTRRQLTELGVAYSTVRRQVERGLLVRIGASTFRSSVTEATPEGDVLAACLDHRGVASHRTAAWLHGLVPWPGLIDITGVGQAAKEAHQLEGLSIPVIVHSSTNLPVDDRVGVGKIPTVSVARSLFGLAALVPDQVDRRVVADAVGKAVDQGLATDPWLWWLLDKRRCRGRNGVTCFESVLAERVRLGPTESWLERELLTVIRGAGMPKPTTQKVIRRSGRFAARVDMIYDAERVVVEALGYAFHRTKEQSSADAARANDLQLLGYLVLQFTTEHIVDHPGRVVDTIRRALASTIADAA